MEIKAILFDVIGTTILEANSSLVSECFRNAFEQHGVPVTNGEIETIRGRDKQEAIELLLQKKNSSSVHSSSILHAFKISFQENLHHFSEEEDMHEVIVYFRTRKIYLGVGTGLPEQLFMMLFEHFNWKRFNFDYIGLSENVGRGRPHPDMINDMCEKLKLNKQNFLKVGDTPSDIEEGKNANVYTVAILRGTVPDNILLDAKPDFAIRSLVELKSILK